MTLHRALWDENNELQATLKGFGYRLCEICARYKDEEELRIHLRSIYERHLREDCILEMMAELLTIVNEQKNLETMLTSDSKSERRLAQVLHKIVQEETGT